MEDPQCVQMLPHPVSNAAFGLGPYAWLQTTSRFRHTNPEAGQSNGQSDSFGEQLFYFSRSFLGLWVNRSDFVPHL